MAMLRLVLITRRFWPQVGGAEKVVSQLAIGLHRRGAAPTILTPRWDPDWPNRVSYGDVPVIRLKHPRGYGWGTWRYLAALTRWLHRHRDRIDAVCVSRMRFEAAAAVAAAKAADVPVVLRAEDAGVGGDCDWQRRSRLGARCGRRCRAADAIIAPDVAVEQELLEAGYAADRIVRIPNGVADAAPAPGAGRQEARAALADVNRDLSLAPDAPLAVYLGRLRRGRGLMTLVQAWRPVLARWPAARLWLIGDGPLRDALYRRITDLDLRGCVLMPGTFDEVDEILQAANALVCPGGRPGLPQAMLEAMAAGVPVIAADVPELHQPQSIADACAELVPARGASALSQALIRAIDRPPSGRTLAAARRRVLQQHSLAGMIAAHGELFERLIAAKRCERGDRPMNGRR